MFAGRGLCQSCDVVLEQHQEVLDLPTPYSYVSSLSLGCEFQSEETVLESSVLPDNSVTEAAVARFLDETPGMEWKMEAPDLTNLMDRQPEVELAKYLSRPVLIKSHIWAQSDTATTYTAWNPWQLSLIQDQLKTRSRIMHLFIAN